MVRHHGGSMTKSNDNEDIVTNEIHETLKRSKELRDKNPSGGITAEHFHSYEYLVSLLARRQALSNRSIERLTFWIIVLTIAVIVLGGVQLLLEIC